MQPLISRKFYAIPARGYSVYVCTIGTLRYPAQARPECCELTYRAISDSSENISAKVYVKVCDIGGERGSIQYKQRKITEEAE